MPAIVALVAGNFPPGGRPRAYGLVGAAGAMAIAVGPLIGGLATTYASWRWVFAGEVIVGAGIVLLGRRMADTPVEERPHLDLLGSLLWALGMGLVVFGVLFSSEWGAIRPKEDGPSILGLSPVVWLILAGLAHDPAVHGSRPPPRRRGRRAPRHAVAVPQPADERRTPDVLLPVRRDDGDLLRDPAVPVRRARALGDRHRPEDHPAVDHDAAGGGGRAEVLPVGLAASGGGVGSRRRW